MSSKKKVVLIYSAVALISLLLILSFRLLDTKPKTQNDRGTVSSFSKIELPPLTNINKKITTNLTGINQAGKTVSLFDLKDKVIVFIQFYSRCNQCLGNNKKVVQDLYREFKNTPNVHFVSVTLDPDFDTPKKLKEIAPLWGADVKNWWMLNVPKKELAEYCREQLWYIDFKDNKDKTNASDAINHDMGVAIIDSNLTFRAKANLFETLEKGQVKLYEAKKKQLISVIKNSL